MENVFRCPKRASSSLKPFWKTKALHQTGSLSPATRQRVLDVAGQLQFRPNTLAKSLHTGLSGTVGLISNDSFGRFTMPIMEGLEAVLAHISGPQHFEAVQLRRAGYLAELEAAPYDTLHGPWTESWGRQAMAHLFGPGLANPDALFCGNDQIARGAADALRELGRRIPDDVAIVGFDNWAVMAEAARPPLTSVDMNLAGLGAEAGRCMAGMIGGTDEQGQRLLPCTLVTRASTLGTP